VQLARAATVLGCRFIEDRLRSAVERGVRQYVLLGAGFDTFAYRQPGWAADLRIIEVDHPASQECKRERLAAAGVSMPPNVAYVPIDFELTTLAEGMVSSHFDASLPAFFAWRGVTQYLTSAGIETTLRYVLSRPRSSGIALTFCLPDALAGEDEAAVRFFADYGAGLGEPWISRFAPERVVEWLRELGFSEITHLTPDVARERYFHGRTDGLRVPIYEQVVNAIV
jgi:methyltransferase (TIGR00027 family)